MSKLSSTAIEVCEYYYLSAPNGEKNKKNGINFAVESILPCTGMVTAAPEPLKLSRVIPILQNKSPGWNIFL